MVMYLGREGGYLYEEIGKIMYMTDPHNLADVH